jgi:hypothetical protein
MKSAFEESIVKAVYGFTPLVRPRGTLGPTFGVHVIKLAARLAIATEPLLDDAQVTAPLPVIGVRGDWWFAPRWRLAGGYEWFDVQVGDAQGVFSGFIVTVERETFDRFGFGAALNNLELDVEARVFGEPSVCRSALWSCTSRAPWGSGAEVRRHVDPGRFPRRQDIPSPPSYHRLTTRTTELDRRL